MKRYLAFLGDEYYPSPAMGDFINDFDSEQEAISAIDEKSESEYNKRGYETLEEYWVSRWGHVFDSSLKKNIIELPKDRNL